MPDQTVAPLSKSADKADDSLVDSAQGANPPTQVTNHEAFGLLQVLAKIAKMMINPQNMPCNNLSIIEDLRLIGLHFSAILLQGIAEQALPNRSVAPPAATPWSNYPEKNTENSCDNVSEISGTQFQGPITNSRVDGSQYASARHLYVNCEPHGKKSEEEPQSRAKEVQGPIKIKGPSFGTISDNSVVTGQQFASGGDLHVRYKPE